MFKQKEINTTNGQTNILGGGGWRPISLSLFSGGGGRRSCDRFGQHGIKVSFWGSGTLNNNIVILVENHPHRNDFFRLDDYHPLGR